MTSLQKSYEGKELGCHFPGSPLGSLKEIRPLTDPQGDLDGSPDGNKQTTVHRRG